MPPNPKGGRALLLTRPRLMVVSGRGGARTPRPGLLLVAAVLALGLISGASAMWGTSGKAAPKLKKSDADMKNTIMKGSKDLYDDPTKPPEWLLADKMVEPGLPTTPPPPPPSMLAPPPELESGDADQNGEPGEGDNAAGGGPGSYAPPVFSLLERASEARLRAPRRRRR